MVSSTSGINKSLFIILLVVLQCSYNIFMNDFMNEWFHQWPEFWLIQVYAQLYMNGPFGWPIDRTYTYIAQWYSYFISALIFLLNEPLLLHREINNHISQNFTFKRSENLEKMEASRDICLPWPSPNFEHLEGFHGHTYVVWNNKGIYLLFRCLCHDLRNKISYFCPILSLFPPFLTHIKYISHNLFRQEVLFYEDASSIFAVLWSRMSEYIYQ